MPKAGTIRQLIRGAIDFGHFDLTYSAGLFDYLDEDTATQLVERMIEMTSPGGEVLIANFLPGIPDVGYMESFMDWRLIYRTEDEVRRIFHPVRDDIASLHTFTDPDSNILFARATKREKPQPAHYYHDV